MSAEEARVLRDAADLIERDGWCRYAGRDKDGRHCALGAMAETTSRNALVPVWALSQYLEKKNWEIPAWNDAQPGPKSVTSALRAAADQVEGVAS